MKLSPDLSTGSPAGSSGAIRRGLPIAGLLLFCSLLVANVAQGGGGSGPATGEAADLVAQARSGDSWAQLNLGAAYDHGLAGFSPDPARAVLWYRRAAVAGLPLAQFNLAHCLATGTGTARNDSEAFSWMLEAAEQELASAQFLAGVMLIEGIGIAPDRVRGARWLRRAANNGDADAASLLERMGLAPAKNCGIACHRSIAGAHTQV